MISCSSPSRAAYGWQRDGGMAPYILAEEKDCVLLPDELSYTDGAQVACGFGTVYEGLEKIGVSGNDQVLVVGLGPVGLAALMLAKALGATKLVGVDTFNSILFGLPVGKRLLRGLGNSLMPQNVDHKAYDVIHWVSAEVAFLALVLYTPGIQSLWDQPAAQAGW